MDKESNIWFGKFKCAICVLNASKHLLKVIEILNNYLNITKKDPLASFKIHTFLCVNKGFKVTILSKFSNCWESDEYETTLDRDNIKVESSECTLQIREKHTPSIPEKCLVSHVRVCLLRLFYFTMRSTN